MPRIIFLDSKEEFKSMDHSTYSLPTLSRGGAMPPPYTTAYRKETNSLAGMILRNWGNSHFEVPNDVVINQFRG